MNITLKRNPAASLRVAVVECPEILLNMFSGARTYPAPPVSLIITDQVIDMSKESVDLDASSISIPLIGEPGLAILLSITPDVADTLEAAPEKSVPRPKGDAKFLGLAERDFADKKLSDAAKRLLDATRQLAPHGELIEGGARRFVNGPDNFVGFTVQNRNQSILVHVRDSEVAKRAVRLKVAPDRRPYIRFWVTEPAQVTEAIELIKASWQRGRYM